MIARLGGVGHVEGVAGEGSVATGNPEALVSGETASASPPWLQVTCAECGQQCIVLRRPTAPYVCASCEAERPIPVDLSEVARDALMGELARRGTLVLSTNVPVGVALEAVEQARRELPLVDREDQLPEDGELEIAGPLEAARLLDPRAEPTWFALLYGAFVGVTFAVGRESRRGALVRLAALAVKWIEALDAREPDGLAGGAR